MRVIHVVPLASDDGAHGGPLTVALGQAAELRARGHRVDVIAGRVADRVRVAGPDGVAVRTFRAVRVAPGRSPAALVSPGLLRWLSRAARDAQVVHVHTGRDLLGLAAVAVARLRGCRVVAQTHGMMAEDGRPAARLLDVVLTRPLLGRADRHLVLTDRDERGVRRIGASSGVRRVPNGVLADPSPRPDDPAAPLDVLFCARLHWRKRPTAFVEMAALLAARFPDVRFSVVGPDGGELAALRRAVELHGLARIVHYEGALAPEAVRDRMRRASVYVLPSVNEPFPMSLLEALSVGLPAVCTTECGIADVLAAHGAVVVTDGSPARLAEAVADLLERPAARAALTTAGRAVLIERFSAAAMVDAVEGVYGELVADRPAALVPGVSRVRP